LKLNDEFGLHGPADALVKLQDNGMPGDIITTGFVLDSKDGYSSAFTMRDPANMRSSQLAGAHFRIGKPDSSEGFPEGTVFHSPLLLANVSVEPVGAHVSVDYTVREKTTDKNGKSATEDNFSTLHVRDLTIAPGAIARVELSDAFDNLTLKGQIIETGTDINYDASSGALIGDLVSVDQTGDYSFEVPIKDPSAMDEMMEGVYPWSTEDGTDTVFHLKNTTGKQVNALAFFNFSGGTYDLGGIRLAPHQTIGFDAKELKDLKIPGLGGQIFPPEATHGQIVWHQETPYSIIGRAEQTNVKEGVAKSFSCGSDCCANYSVVDYMSPGSVSGDISGTTALEVLSYGHDCAGNCFGFTNDTYCTLPIIGEQTRYPNMGIGRHQHRDSEYLFGCCDFPGSGYHLD